MSPVDSEDLISHLSGGLDPHDRARFRKAAENALATEPACSGEGASYRVISEIWRSYFRPPADTRGASWYATERREHPRKLIAEEPPPRHDARKRAHAGARSFEVVRIGRGRRD